MPVGVAKAAPLEGSVFCIHQMKRYGHLFEQICSMENLRLAHQNAKKGKGWYAEVKEVDSNLEYYLGQLREILLTHNYHTSEYEVFYKQEGSKQRKIYKLPYFPDRICQWAILQVIEPYIIRNLTQDTYSAIPERGIHKALLKLQDAMWNDSAECMFCFKLDGRHFYQSINHEILKQKYARIFKDEDLLELLYEIIDSINTAEIDDLLAIYTVEEDVDTETGIPIGNYLSQYSGNFYFSSFDHWIKEELHVKYYFRYMDDIVIFAKTKEELHAMVPKIEQYFHDNLRLKMKSNWQIFPSFVRGVDFLGYRTFSGYTLLRKSTAKTMKAKLITILEKEQSGKHMNYSEWCCINSYKGWLKYCDSFRLQRKYVDPLLPYAEAFYTTKVKSQKKGCIAA